MKRFDARDGRPEWWSVVAAAGLTAAVFSISLVTVRTIGLMQDAPAAPRERIALVRLRAPAEPSDAAVASPRLPRGAGAPPPAVPPPASDRPATSPPSVAPVDSAAPPRRVPSDGPAPSPPARAGGPVASSAPTAAAAPSAVRFRGFAALDSAARDSIARLSARHDSLAWLTFTLPAAVVDAEWRREHERVAARVAEKRPWIASGGPRASGPVGVTRGPGVGVGVSIGVPLFASGPSRRERKRDSVIHAGNVERLARIFERARARGESVAAVRRDSTPR